MNQLGRRSLYLLFGLLPSAFGAFSALSIGISGFWAGTSVAIGGFLYALPAAFPVKEKVFRYAALFLCIGASFLVVLSFISLAEAAKAISSGRIVPTTATVLWCLGWLIALVGPASCTIHFLWRSRRTPNNSSKPTPLRGAA